MLKLSSAPGRPALEKVKVNKDMGPDLWELIMQPTLVGCTNSMGDPI